MDFIANLSLRSKLISALGLIVLVFIITGYFNLKTLSGLQENSQEMYYDRLVPVRDLGELNFRLMKIRSDLRTYLLEDQTNRSTIRSKIEEDKTAIDRIWEKYLGTSLAEEEKALLPAFKENWPLYKTGIDNALAKADAEGLLQAYQFITTHVAGYLDKTLTAVNKLIEFNNTRSEELNKNSKITSDSARTNIIWSLIISILLSFGVVYYLIRHIAQPLTVIAENAREIASGKFDTKLTVYHKNDEVGQLSQNLESMTHVVLEKLFWYEQILDAIPFPISVTDKDMNWTFVNKPVEQLFNAKRDTFTGKACNNWNAAICKTENCGVQKLRNKQKQTFFDQFGSNFQVDTTYLYNAGGEVTGHVEVVQDISKSKKMELYLSSSATQMLAEMDKLATGDLTVQLPVNTDDDIGKLFDGFNKSITNIARLMAAVGEAVQATASASTQISSSAEEMAAGAEEQSAQTGEVASAVEEMTSTIIETSKNTSFAAETAKNSGNRAVQGGSVVKQTIEGMNKISEVVNKSANTVFALGQNSEKIGEIVQVIDDIADQTNLLALNAAIEAARAGEQGRGFAVVADEVRKLAERTTKATKEIASMIKKIQNDTTDAVYSMKEGVNEVEKGKALATEAGKVLEDIVKGANQVTDIVVQVAATTEQQSSTAEEIGNTIDSINRVMSETSSGIQQIAHATEDLNRLTDNLQNLLGEFIIPGNTQALSYRQPANRQLTRH